MAEFEDPQSREDRLPLAQDLAQEVSGAFFGRRFSEADHVLSKAVALYPEDPQIEWWAFNLPYLLAQAEGRLPGYTPEQILHSPYLLDQADLILHRLGLRGEKDNRRIVFLSAIGGILFEPIHIVIHGDSAGGKNNLVKSVLELFPEDQVEMISGMSTHALEYQGGRIEGVLVIDELEGQEDAEYALRVGMSEGRISRLTVNRDPKSGKLKGEKVEVVLAGSVITTTTRFSVHDENSTRVFHLWIDEGEALTDEVLDAQAAEAEGEVRPILSEELEVWRSALNRLEQADVIIPFARRIKQSLPKNRLRIRRDFPRILTLIRASALLHQLQRDRDKQDRVIAEVADYRLVYPLLQTVLGPSMTDVTPKALALCELHNELLKDDQAEWLRRSTLETEAEGRGIASHNTVRKWCKRLSHLGIWEGKLIDRAWAHRSLRDPNDEPLALPTPEEVAAYQSPTNRPLVGLSPSDKKTSVLPTTPTNREGGSTR